MSLRWHENHGRVPGVLNAKGKRCFVRLHNGREPGESWEATSLIWRRDGHPFSIVEWAQDAGG